MRMGKKLKSKIKPSDENQLLMTFFLLLSGVNLDLNLALEDRSFQGAISKAKHHGLSERLHFDSCKLLF